MRPAGVVSLREYIQGGINSAEGFANWTKLPQMRRLFGVGVDFGTNNPSTGLLLGLARERRRDGGYGSCLWFVDEWLHDTRGPETSQLSPPQQANLFARWLDQPHTPYDTALRPEFVIVDPAVLHFARELNLIGIPTSGGLNNVSYGIATQASLLPEDHLVVSEHCPGFIAEALGYSWDAKAARLGTAESVKVNDHPLDGGRHAIATLENMWRPLIDWPTELPWAA